MKRLMLGVIVVSALLVLFGIARSRQSAFPLENQLLQEQQLTDKPEEASSLIEPHSLSIEYLKTMDFPGSAIVFEQKLSDGNNYSRHVVSYQSAGNKIFALMTIPKGVKPEVGWPVVVFNHGYIAPSEYRTTERYAAYQNAFASAGYITFKSDYRGHGSSEGEATGGYGSPGYTIDVLNAVSALTAYELADSNRMGMWGHSMGGYITLRSMVVNKQIKAGVIWAGVVASYPDLLNNWRRQNSTPPPQPTGSARRWREILTQEYGTPESNPNFWNSISANSFLSEISGPIQIHHGTADSSVPVEFSTTLHQQLQTAGKESELYIYQGDDHNLSRNLSTALRRSVEFFDQHLK